MILEKLKQSFPTEILSTAEEKGERVAVIRKERCHEILQFLKEDPECRFEMLVDLCGVDYLSLGATGEKPRFEVVYHLSSLTLNHRLRLRVKIAEEEMTLPTVTDLWKAADWFEREAFDMFGFIFEGHPNLKRLLMFEGFVGHPLRKDYPIERRQKIPVPQEKL